MKNKIISVLLVLSLTACAVPSVIPTQVEAEVTVNDSRSEDGIPSMAKEDISITVDGVKKTIKKGTVVRLKDGNLQYNGTTISVPVSKFLMGAALTEYAAEHPQKFLSKVTTIKDTSTLYDVETQKPIAIVKNGTMFLSETSQNGFYVVDFDGKKALLSKDDVTSEVYVCVTSYDDATVTINKIFDNLRDLADKLNIDISEEQAYNTIDNEIVNFAKQFVGNPYIYGGISLTDGCDCSGFVQQVYKHFGISLPRTSATQSQVGTEVSVNELKPGDLLFFSNKGIVHHVAMYAGNGMIVHAKGSKYGIVYESLDGRTPSVCRRYIHAGSEVSDEK